MFNPTEEQKRIFHFIKKRPENILVKAFAGTGKTTTVVEAVKLLDKNKSIMFLAFNKHIQEELKTKLPEYVRCYTTYGLGLSAIKRKYGESIQFDEFKIDKIIQKYAKKWDLDDDFDSEDSKSQYLNTLKKMVNLCKLTLTIKPEFIEYLADRHEINISKKRDIKRILKILDQSSSDKTTYDYVDMVYIPATDNSVWLFPQDYIFIDEVQDVNRCQIRIVEKSLKKDKFSGKVIGRLISIGDAFQNIYGFSGSDDKSFQWFEKYENTKILPLSVSFRCAKNVIKKAQEIVPDIKALDNAPDGVVRNGSVLDEVENGDFVLCRTTMPLIKLFFELLSKQKKAVIKGSDIGIQLIELIGKIKTIEILDEFWKKELIVFKNKLKSSGILNPHEHSGYVALEDKVTALLFLSKFANDISDLKLKIKTIFSDEVKDICLSTIHKIKGLEADRVFIIRPDLIPLPNTRGWQLGQEQNLEYVAYTRAKLELIFDRDWSDEE